jgi:pimeloyl-ACP methyl ester carboxylesterase
MSQRPPYRFCFFSVCLLLAGCASLPADITTHVATTCNCDQAQGLVFILDGAGNFGVATDSFIQVVKDTHTPVCVRPYVWSHGYGRVLADQMGQENIRIQGKHLAELVLLHKHEQPEIPIYLVAHSAGAAVVLVAADVLPPDAVERVILLSPAVSSNRDLRGALTASRQGVDVFYSKDDWWYLGTIVTLIGTSDRRWSPAAGRVGFQPVIACPADGRLYEKLRQYPWDESQEWTGNLGGHYGSHQPGFLKAYVLPLLSASGDGRR